MKTGLSLCLLLATALLGAMLADGTAAQDTGSPSIKVDVDNFVRAESDHYFAPRGDTIGKFNHHREVMAIEDQVVIRPNRDTLYSMGLFDLDAGPITLTMPEAGERFMSVQLISEDHYVPAVHYGAGTYTITKEEVGTRYVILGVRILVEPEDPADVAEVHRLQDAITATQPNGVGSFKVPNWDDASLTKVRDALLSLAETVPDTRGMFGTRDEVDPVRHLIGTASAFGGNPEKDAFYLNVVPPGNDGTTIHKLHVPAEVPVEGFWSVSLYNAKGYFEKNRFDAYSLNNITAAKSADGSVDIQFGGCDDKVPNCLPIMPAWNYMVRLYRPRAEVLDGSWKFPEARPEK